MMRVTLLGEMTLEVDGRQLELPASRRVRSLLGLLALERRTHPRGQLAARFWPDVLDESARTSLRSALSALRRALGANADRYLLATRDAVALAGPDEVWTDVGEFERLLAEGQLEDALELARGDLLEELDDEWVYERREEHRACVVALLERMAAGAEAAGDLASAVALTRREIALDPLSEEAHRELIRRLALNGDRSAALTTYRRLADRFASELGIVPSPATRELIERIRSEEATSQPLAPLMPLQSTPLAPPMPSGSTPGTPTARPSRRMIRSRQARDPAAEPLPVLPPVSMPAAERRTGTVTLLFTDQVGSTEALQRLGDEEGERLRRAHFGLLREAAAMHGGEEVKNLGDGLMVAFVSAVDAVACAIAIQQTVHRAHASGELAFAVRTGLNVGEPIHDEGDYFGTPVVIAKRLCDAGAPGQILASELVRALIGTRGGFSYRALGPLPLKGVAEPIPACEVIWEPSTEVRVPLPALLAGEERGTFVGRSDAAAALEAEWAAVREGGLRVVALAGEPGIGKTRLVREFARTAHERGATVLAGNCHEETFVPYQPFIEALRHYIACCPPAELAVQIAPRRAQLAAIVPELEDPRAPYGPTGLGAEQEPEQERFRLFEAISSLLADAAHLRPLALILDDLHWADRPSLLLLRHLARSAKDAPLMVLGSYRPVEVGEEHPLAHALAELRRARALAQLSLSGLGEAEVAELIEERAGQQAPRGFVRRVADRSEGNPFFIEELLHDVGAEADWDAAAVGVPDSVRDLLLRRLRGLGDDCRQALSVAAVAGREFELGVLERVLEHPRDRLTGKDRDPARPDRSRETRASGANPRFGQPAYGRLRHPLIDLIEEAINADVLVEPAQSVGRLSFSHALFRETIYEQLSATRRAAIHGRIAAAIEETPTDRPEERAGTLAHHYRAAGDLRKAFDYHRRAAVAAERVHAQETALENLEGAIVAGELLGMTAATEEAIRDLYRARAWTLRALGERDRALADLEHALAGARAAGDRASEMHVQNALGFHWHVLDPPASRRCHEEALAIAEELGDESGQVGALSRLSLVLANELEFAEAVELGERALRIARRTGEELAVSQAMDSLKFAALQLGDLERLEQLCAELERVQRERGDEWYLQWTLCESSYVPLERCDWREAERRVAEALAISERLRDPYSGVLIRDTMSSIARCRGDYAKSLAFGREAVAQADTPAADWLGWATAGLATPFLDLRAAEEAIAVLERGLAAAERNRARGQIFRCLGALSSATRLAGAEARAQALAERAQRIAEQVTTPPGNVDFWGEQAYLAIAETHLANGDIERAEEAMRGRLRAWERSGARRSIAMTARFLSRCAEARGDWTTAGRMLARAAEAAGEEGLICERWQIEAGLARVASAAGSLTDAEEHGRRAHELIHTMAASVEDEEIGARFRERARAEIDRPGSTLRD
jgi:class 3 adenylate cyclase/DNA-binding SARP family transcriptional activator/tetratricopeptide (TPR) repeat protein